MANQNSTAYIDRDENSLTRAAMRYASACRRVPYSARAIADATTALQQAALEYAELTSADSNYETPNPR